MKPIFNLLMILCSVVLASCATSYRAFQTAMFYGEPAEIEAQFDQWEKTRISSRCSRPVLVHAVTFPSTSFRQYESLMVFYSTTCNTTYVEMIKADIGSRHPKEPATTPQKDSESAPVTPADDPDPPAPKRDDESSVPEPAPSEPGDSGPDADDGAQGTEGE